ncbi:MAG: exo-1,3-beta-glucanase [Phylliscum demangeonii]|nr:MAG: exo-1,3-beta-glucanase [Phylliscum demangeonii]
MPSSLSFVSAVVSRRNDATALVVVLLAVILHLVASLPTGPAPLGAYPNDLAAGGKHDPAQADEYKPFSLDGDPPRIDVIEPLAERSEPLGLLRGVNVGGWLLLEKWMSPELFAGTNATDQWTFDGTAGAAAKLQAHWDTWFTQADVRWLRGVGINTLRVPIGFWAYDNAETPYLHGADAYLEKAIGWAREAGLKVWVDCHGLPGSQNGLDHSGHAVGPAWQTGPNMARALAVLQTMARKYGAVAYADTVIGLQLVNEPAAWGTGSTMPRTRLFAYDGYQAVRAQAANPSLLIVMHDAFQGPAFWTDFPAILGSDGLFGVDTHQYQCFVPDDSTLDQAQHIRKACARAPDLRAANARLPTFVGEWSPVTNICVLADGSTTPGSSCAQPGCQCQSADVDRWNPQMVAQVRRYVEAQLDVFESSTSGHFMWSFKGPGAWSFVTGVQNGFIPNPITARRFPSQCGPVP